MLFFLPFLALRTSVLILPQKIVKLQKKNLGYLPKIEIYLAKICSDIRKGQIVLSIKAKIVLLPVRYLYILTSLSV